MSYWSGKKVVITGGAGFIGSNLAEDLVKAGSHVTVVDNLERGKLEFIRPIIDKITFLKKDVREINVCLEICEGAEIVFHLASKVGGINYYLNKPGEVITQNIQMDSNMIQAVVDKKVKKFFYASSAHVYPINLQLETESPIIRETDAVPANPELSYGWAKLIAEKQLEYLNVEGKLNGVAIARFIGIYGKNQDVDIDTGSVIPVFTRRAIEYPKLSPFLILGTGEETRSYCFIDDTVECMKKMVEKLDYEKFIGPINVGKNERIRIKDIAKEVIKISGKPIDIEYDLKKKTIIWGQVCDCTLAKNELDGWEARTPLAEGLKHVYNDIEFRLKD